MPPIIRVEDAGLGVDAQVRLVLSNVRDLDLLKSRWASSGATLERYGDRLRATTTVDALSRAAGRAFGADAGVLYDRLLQETVAAWGGPAPAWVLPGGQLCTNVRPLVMGVVNVTPDSFSDGGSLYPDGHPDTAIEHGTRLRAEGADLLDVGGESSRPGSQPVDADEERERVLPVVQALSAQGALVSIDTTKPAVAEAAVKAGAEVVNDVSGGRDAELLDVVARTGAAYVLMHTRGTPEDMQQHTDYDDVVAEVYEFLSAGLARCVDAGIALDRIAVDPGIGFAKTITHNLALLSALRQLRGLGRPVVVGASRKSFLGALAGGAPASDRLEGSLACVAAAVAAGAAVVRVHDVRASVRVAAVARAVASGDRLRDPTDWPAARS